MVSGLSAPVSVANVTGAVVAMPPPASTSIHVNSVSISYPLAKNKQRTVLENISLEIEEGEFVVLLG